jgi:hypothetical protein
VPPKADNRILHGVRVWRSDRPLRHQYANAPPAGASSDGSGGMIRVSPVASGGVRSGEAQLPIAVGLCRDTLDCDADGSDNSRNHRPQSVSSVAEAPAGRCRSVDPASNPEHKFHTDLSSGGPGWSRLTVLRQVGHQATNNDLWVRRCRRPAAASLAPDVGVIDSWSPRGLGARGASEVSTDFGAPQEPGSRQDLRVRCCLGTAHTAPNSRDAMRRGRWSSEGEKCGGASRGEAQCGGRGPSAGGGTV